MTNKKLHIKISTVDNKLEILLKDFAGGIENQNIHKIFEPYYSTKKNLNGSGLGLFVSRSIIRQQFNGELNIENHKDKGKKGVIAQIIIPL
ncbi:MAG: Anti-sigma F factor [Arcobacter lacus]|nr:MAG: Anti-sigma F factor [Arcobacter lacus]